MDAGILTVLLWIVLPLLIYWYSTRNHNYWKKRGIPFVKAYPLIGSVCFGKKTLEEVEEERYYKYGRVYGFYDGNKPKISIAEPELLKGILVKDFQYFTTRIVFNSGDPIFDKMLSLLEGDDWKRIRAIVTPTFSTSKIKRVMNIFQECSKTLIQNIKSMSNDGEDPVDLTKFYGAFTMDVIASAAFSTKIDCLNDPENEFVKKAKNAFKQDFGFKIIFFIVMPTLMRKLGITLFDPENMDFFKSVTRKIIEERKKTGQTRNDFLQLLMDTATEIEEEEKLDYQNGDLANNYDNSGNPLTMKGLSNKNLSMDELVAQCVIFFLAGYHTTATTLGITTYLLALNPDIQEKLYQEIRETLKETDGVLTYESVQKMKYLDNVISESLRLYAPATRLDRTANADYKLGDTGVIIPKGMVVTIPSFAMHRDSKLFLDAQRFDPDRFSSEEKEKIIPYSYLPFGAGPRNCVGMRFAMMELKVCLVYVLSSFEAVKCAETKTPLEFGKAANVLQPKSIYLRMDLRKETILNL